MDLRKSLKSIGETDPFEDELLSCCVTPHSVVAGTATGPLLVWSRKDLNKEPSVVASEHDSVEALVAVQDVVLTGTGDGVVRAYEEGEDASLTDIGGIGAHGGFPVEVLAKTSGDELVASLSHDNVVRFFDATNASRIKQMLAAASGSSDDPRLGQAEEEEGGRRAAFYGLPPSNRHVLVDHGDAQRRTDAIRRVEDDVVDDLKSSAAAAEAGPFRPGKRGARRRPQHAGRPRCRSYGCARALICRSLMRRLTPSPAAPALRAELKVAAVGSLEDPHNPRIEYLRCRGTRCRCGDHDDGPRAVVVAQRVEAANGRRVLVLRRPPAPSPHAFRAARLGDGRLVRAG